MNQIKTKIGFILILLLSVVMLVPSASSKYVKQYRSIIMLKTTIPYMQMWYTEARGFYIPGGTKTQWVSTIPFPIKYFSYAKNGSSSDGSLADANSGNTNSVIISGRTDKDGLGKCSEGYYFIVAKGGDGGSGYVSSSATSARGYGGIVAGVIKFNPSTQQLVVFLGGSGADGTSSGSNNQNDAGRTGIAEDAIMGGFAYKAQPGSGGAATMVFLTDEGSTYTKGNLIMVAGAAGGSGSGSSTHVGGAGGSNVVFYSGALTTGEAFSKGDTIGYGYAAQDGVGGTSGNGAGVLVAGSGANASGGLFSATAWSGQHGGSSIEKGGGGGSGLNGGGGEYAGGAGGGSSFIKNGTVMFYGSANSMGTSEMNAAKYREYMQKIFEQYKVNGTYTVNSDGTITDKNANLSSFVALYYLGSSEPAGLTST